MHPAKDKAGNEYMRKFEPHNGLAPTGPNNEKLTNKQAHNAKLARKAARKVPRPQ